MTRDMKDFEETKVAFEAGVVNPSFTAEVRNELMAIESDPCLRCDKDKAQSCIGCVCRV